MTFGIYKVYKLSIVALDVTFHSAHSIAENIVNSARQMNYHPYI